MVMLKLTNLDGGPVFVHPDAVEIIRPTVFGESYHQLAQAVVMTSAGIIAVKETVTDVVKKLG
jgi:hypothetical protein